MYATSVLWARCSSISSVQVNTVESVCRGYLLSKDADGDLASGDMAVLNCVPPQQGQALASECSFCIKVNSRTLHFARQLVIMLGGIGFC